MNSTRVSINWFIFIYILYFILDTLKSVYELRKSHAALVNRPMSSQPFNNNNRRNI